MLEIYDTKKKKRRETDGARTHPARAGVPQKILLN